MDLNDLKGWLHCVVDQLDHKNINLEVPEFLDGWLPATTGACPCLPRCAQAYVRLPLLPLIHPNPEPRPLFRVGGSSSIKAFPQCSHRASHDWTSYLFLDPWNGLDAFPPLPLH